MLNKVTNFAERMIFEAGEILLQGFEKEGIEVEYKSKTELVTDYDKRSEELLVAAITKGFPDHSIVAEEGNRRNGSGDLIWYIDPLDATNNYVHGIAHFCISIGLYSKKLGKVVIGVVYDPYNRELFKATKGGGAYLNGRRISVSSVNDLSKSMIATGFPYEKGNSEKNNLVEFNKFLSNIQGIRRMGSAALDLCYVACGRFDGFWEPELKSWDMAGGSLIVEEAGGKVTNYSGEQFNPEFPEIVASNGTIHNKMIQILEP